MGKSRLIISPICFEDGISSRNGKTPNFPVWRHLHCLLSNDFSVDWIWNYYRSISGSNLQLGEVQHSFGYGGTGKAAENCVFKNYGSRFGVGDILGCYLVSFRLAVEPNEMIKSHLWLTASLFFVQQLEIFVPTTQTTIFKLIVQIIFALVINETREWRVGRRPHSIC